MGVAGDEFWFRPAAKGHESDEVAMDSVMPGGECVAEHMDAGVWDASTFAGAIEGHLEGAAPMPILAV